MGQKVHPTGFRLGVIKTWSSRWYANKDFGRMLQEDLKIKKFVKNAKWLCGKFDTKNIVLHSFNHLSLSKATPEFSKGVLDEVVERLMRTDYHVVQTPFGYFNEFVLHVAGDSLAKVYKEF